MFVDFMRQIQKPSVKVYRAGWSEHQIFASWFTILPTPITSGKVMLFIAYGTAEMLAISTIKAYLAGLGITDL